MNDTVFSEGEKVYAIVKNISNFKPEIIEAIVTKINDKEIELSKQSTPLTTYVYSFPKDNYNDSIFKKLEDAKHELGRR